MIPEAELRRRAAGQKVDPLILNLDYCLGWFLGALYGDDALQDRLRFKGGTCLRKAYFPEYRFSEDLDFTATAVVNEEWLREAIERTCQWSEEKGGPDFSADTPRFEVVSDEYGAETLQVRLYLRGPLRFAGSPQAIRLDVTQDEPLLLPAEKRPLIHPYSDAEALGRVILPCYPLAEMLAEKIRAVGGQRRFAISRDIFDIHRLVHAGVGATSVLPLLEKKFAAKGIGLTSVSARTMRARRSQFERDWKANLSYLIPRGQEVPFGEAWKATLGVLAQIESAQ